jgi:hypothetical protein
LTAMAPVPASSLVARAWISLVILAVVMGLLVFGSAGTARYWQGWVYLAVFFSASLITTLDLVRRDPALLERRMRGGPTAEKRPTQRLVMLGASVGFISLLVLPALDRRLHWTASVPTRRRRRRDRYDCCHPRETSSH